MLTRFHISHCLAQSDHLVLQLTDSCEEFRMGHVEIASDVTLAAVCIQSGGHLHLRAVRCDLVRVNGTTVHASNLSADLLCAARDVNAVKQSRALRAPPST